MKKLVCLITFLISMTAIAAVDLPILMSYPELHTKNYNELKKNKIFIFINRTCPCTQQNIPYINELVKEFPQFEFIGVHSVKNAHSKSIDEVISEYNPRFSIIDDKDLLVANILKANRTPQVVILNDENEIVYTGGVTNRTNPKGADKFYLHNALAELAQKKPITEKITRSLGCIILR